MYLRDVAKGDVLRTVELQVAYSSIHLFIYSSVLQGCMYLWDVAKGDVLRTVELVAYSSIHLFICFTGVCVPMGRG